MQHFAAKLVTDKVVESKLELQELFTQVAKCNSSELSNLARDLLDMKETTKMQQATLAESASNFKVLESQIKVLELSIAQNGKDNQPAVQIVKLTKANPQTSLETVREHIEAEVNRLLLRESDTNHRWLEDRLTPKIKKIEEDRKAFETLKKQTEEVLAAQSSIYSALTQLSQTVREIPTVPVDRIGMLLPHPESTTATVNKLAESLGDLVIRISTLERTSHEESPGVTSRFDNLEKFIQRILQTQSELQGQVNSLQKNPSTPTGQSSGQMFENPQTIPLINSLRYDLDNIKNDIFLHKQKSDEYFRKHETLEKKVFQVEDAVALSKFGKAIADLSAQNFMAGNFSKMGFPENSGSQGYDPLYQDLAPRAVNADNNLISGNHSQKPSYLPGTSPFASMLQQPQSVPKQVVGVVSGPHDAAPPVHKNTGQFGSGGASAHDMRNSINGDEFDRALDNMSMIDKQMDQSVDGFDEFFGIHSMRGVGTQNPTKSQPGFLGGPPKRTITAPALMPIDEVARQDDEDSHSHTKAGENFMAQSSANLIPAPMKLGGRPPAELMHQPAAQADVAVPQTVAAPLKKATTDESNTSILNQSLNSSIRIPKKHLKEVDRFIVPGIAHAVEVQRTSSLTQEPPIQTQTSEMLQNQKASNQEDDDESILELNMDEEGFLLDEQGQRILNDMGQPIRLSDEQIEALKFNGMYEEVETSVMR